MENGKDKPRYAGVTEVLGGKEFVIPSLSVGQAKRLWPEILDLDQGITPQNLPQKHDKAVDIIYAAMTRNYPDLKREDLEDLLDLGNLRRILMLVAGQSGMSRPSQPVREKEESAAVQ